MSCEGDNIGRFGKAKQTVSVRVRRVPREAGPCDVLIGERSSVHLGKDGEKSGQGADEESAGSRSRQG